MKTVPFLPAAMSKMPLWAARSVPNGQHAAKPSVKGIGSFAGSRFMPTARTGVRHAEPAGSFWRNSPRIWRCSAPKRAGDMSVISFRSSFRILLISESARIQKTLRSIRRIFTFHEDLRYQVLYRATNSSRQRLFSFIYFAASTPT